MQVILDKTNHNLDWDTTYESYYPLILLKLIEKKVLAQTKDQYIYAIVYDQEYGLYGFHQHKLKNEQYHERFNTKFDVGEYIGITRQHCVIMDGTEQETF